MSAMMPGQLTRGGPGDMPPESRLDRIERIAKLFARAGRRTRSKVRDQNEKINILINLHIENEERFARNEERIKENEERFKENEERFKENEERFAKNEERFARLAEKLDEKLTFILDLEAKNQERFAELMQAQASSDRRLDSVIEIIRQGTNGST
jgi:hypothetical protein